MDNSRNRRNKKNKQTNDEKKDEAQNASIEEILDKNGLDGDFWKAQFEKKGIKTNKQMQHVDEKVFEILNLDTRYPWEKNALKACFGLDKDNEMSNEEIDKRQKLIEDTRKSLQDLTKKLDEATDEKERMEKMKIKLQIPEGQRDLHKALTKMELLGTDLTTRKQPTPSETINKISSGQILRGYFIQNDVKKRVIPRKRLIKINEEVEILDPEMEETFTNQEFFSEKEAAMYDHVVKHWGFSAVGSIGMLGKFTLEIGGSMKSTEDTSQNNISEQGYTEIKETVFVPTASFSLEDVAHYLSPEALCELIKIDKNIGEGGDHETQNMCSQFFETFGSHYFAGTYHFGGRYTRSVICRSNREVTKSESIKLSKYALQGGGSGMNWFVGGIQAEFDKSNDKSQSKYREYDDYHVEKRIVKCGGPSEVDTVAQWKLGLVKYPSTWNIISMDAHKNDWKGVWELLSEKKPSEIKNIIKLCSALKQASNTAFEVQM